MGLAEVHTTYLHTYIVKLGSIAQGITISRPKVTISTINWHLYYYISYLPHHLILPFLIILLLTYRGSPVSS